MGVFGSKQFIRNDKVEGQGKSVMLLAKKFKLSAYELDRIYHEFCKYEDPDSHLAEIKFIFDSCKLPYRLFDSILFQMFDKTKCGYLNFQEYVIAMYGLLSSDDDGLANLCFTLFDTEGSLTLHVTEAKYLVNTVWEFKPNVQTLSALRKLDQNKEGYITLPEFVLLSRHFPDMLRPIKQTRQVLRKKTVFTRFWKQLTARRVREFGPATMFHIMDLKDLSLVACSMDYLNLRSDVVPPQFVEQYRLTTKKRQNCLKGNIELPYEITSQIENERQKVVNHIVEGKSKSGKNRLKVSPDEKQSGDSTDGEQQYTEQKENGEEELVVAGILDRVKHKGDRRPQLSGDGRGVVVAAAKRADPLTNAVVRSDHSNTTVWIPPDDDDMGDDDD